MKSRFSIGTFLLLLILVGALIASALLAPKAQEAKRIFEIESAATPTPTARVDSMLLVTLAPGATPTPTAVLLKSGVKGDEVTRLQKRLTDLGYYTGSVDGQYGAGTEEAVKRFQTQSGLKADGLAGSATLQAIYAVTAETYKPTPSPTPSPTPTVSLLKKGSRGEAVKMMQQRLQELGYYSGNVDGDFGSGTEDALRLFQKQNGLTADGIAAKKTFAVLYSDAALQVTVTPTPDPEAPPILVNRTHPVDQNDVPSDLVDLSKVIPTDVATLKGSDIRGNRTAAEALVRMLRAAHEDGVTRWQISAGYRSYSYQQKLFDSSVKDYESQGFSHANAVSATRQTVADPGTSEHHTGLAFDLTVPGSIFKGTPEQIWLHKHCWEYGFIIRYPENKEKITGYLAECWHVRYVGLSHALAMRDSGQCLEEYLNILD